VTILLLLTHLIGAALFILWLTSRTRSNWFWFFIEIIAETYALSILFTLNSRRRFRKGARPDSQDLLSRQLAFLATLDTSRDSETTVRSPPSIHRDPPTATSTRRIDLEPIIIRKDSQVSQFSTAHDAWDPISPIVDEVEKPEPPTSTDTLASTRAAHTE